MDAADGFLAKRRAVDQQRYRAMSKRLPVLSEHQMAWRQRREIPVGDSNDLEIVRKHLRP